MKTLIAIALLSLAVMLVPARASATTATDCQVLIADLSVLITQVTYLRADKADKTLAQLQHHLDNATTELNQLDLRSAAKEMGNFEFDVNRAVTAAVFSDADGAALNASADGVIACVQAVTGP